MIMKSLTVEMHVSQTCDLQLLPLLKRKQYLLWFELILITDTFEETKLKAQQIGEVSYHKQRI